MQARAHAATCYRPTRAHVHVPQVGRQVASRHGSGLDELGKEFNLTESKPALEPAAHIRYATLRSCCQ